MKKILLLGILLTPCVAFAATDCRIQEYSDHYVAICDGDAQQAAAARRTDLPELAPAQAETFVALIEAQSKMDPEQELTISRSDLAVRHGEIWLKSMQRQ